MPTIGVKIDKLVFEKAKYTQTLDKTLDAAFRRAIRAFLKETIQHVPVDSGMSQGSFLNIGKHFRAGLPTITPKRRNRVYHTGEIKTPQLGASLATPPEQVLTRSAPTALDTIAFRVNTKVFQYILHEPKWNSFTMGLEAFRASFADILDRLPKVEDFIVSQHITLAGKTVTRTKRKLK